MKTTWLRPVLERDRAMKDHLDETTFYYDEATGELWKPTAMPASSAAWPDTDDDNDLDGW